MLDVAILVFDGVEELDFCGPFEVFGAAAELLAAREGEGRSLRVRTAGLEAGRVRCAKGLVVEAAAALDAIEAADVVVVPGGIGTRVHPERGRIAAWLRDVAPRCRHVASVCTGAFLLEAAGLLAGRRATTHWAFCAALRARGVEVVEGVRFVEDGPILTAAGVTAGIDLALGLVERTTDAAFAGEVARYLEYPAR